MPGPWTASVNINVLDGSAGIVSVPSQRVQAIIGTALSGTVNQVVPTTSLATLRDTFTCGPLMEAAGLVVQAGGVVFAVRAPTVTAGVILGAGAVGSGVSAASDATPIVVTTSAPHGLTTGAVVTIASVGGNTAANGTWVVTVLSATTFSIAATGNSAYTSGGTVTAKGSLAFGSGAGSTFQGTDTPYFTGTPNDDCNVQVVCQTGFTEGTAGGTVLVSVDGGRKYGAPIPIGTGATLALKDVGGVDTGLTLNIGSTKTWIGGGIQNGKIIGDYVRSTTVAPQPNDAGVQGALQALVTYLDGNPGAFPIVQVVMNAAASDATALQSGGSMNLDAMALQFLFERGIMSARDASPPGAWGGTGETETAWLAAINSDISSTTAKRVTLTGGHYNMPSAFPTSFAGAPSYRRPFSFALAAREVSIDPQRHAGKVGGAQGGALSQIVTNPVVDKSDGFVYHNERTTPSLDYLRVGGVGRFATAWTVPRKQGFFASNPLTLAPSGSDFTLLPRGLVIDVACTLVYDALVNFTFADFLTRTNGTLSDTSAATIAGAASDALNSGMQGVGMISSFAVAVDQTQNVQVTMTIRVTVTILGVGYVMEQDVTIGFANQLAASAA